MSTIKPTPLLELLAEHAGEHPLGAFPAQHNGRLVGDRVERAGPVQVTAVLERTAVVEISEVLNGHQKGREGGGRRRTARLVDLAVDPAALS